MHNNIMKKIYYRITFQTATALSVGSGENRYSDSDIVKDSAGNPFIPGSSLAGIYRSLLPESDVVRYFGTPKSESAGEESRILVYDAKLRDAAEEVLYRSTVRDGVALDEWKTGKAGSKFDFEVVEPGAEFVTYLEQNCMPNDRDIGEKLIGFWEGGRVCIGQKTMRGLGSIGEISVCRRSFDLTKKTELEAWLDFDMYCSEAWNDAEFKAEDGREERERKTILLKFILKQKGGISIRRYTTKVNGEGVQPDAEQLTSIRRKDGTEVPYIPGSSWSGAFRHHMERLIPGCTQEYFGTCEKRSSVRFGESFIEGASPKVLTRNAVDRFTAGVIETALFTEKMWYGGETVLRIEFPSDADVEFQQALAASLADLHVGILSVGGLTAIGRGVFEGKSLSINDVSISLDDERIYEQILTAFKRG